MGLVVEPISAKRPKAKAKPKAKRYFPGIVINSCARERAAKEPIVLSLMMRVEQQLVGEDPMERKSLNQKVAKTEDVGASAPLLDQLEENHPLEKLTPKSALSTCKEIVRKVDHVISGTRLSVDFISKEIVIKGNNVFSFILAETPMWHRKRSLLPKQRHRERKG